MMNNKGFTLIELIMAIAILAMLAVLTTPNIINLIDKNKADNYNSAIDSIVEAAELYVSNNRYDIKFYDSSGKVRDYCTPTDTKSIYATITLKKLIDSKEISENIENPCTETTLYSLTKIKITLNCATDQFSYDIDETTSRSTLKRKSSVTGIDGLKVESCSDLY